MPDKPICFVVSPIGEPGSDIRKRSDQVLKHIITPAAKEYEVIRADRIAEPGDITSQVIEHLLVDPIIVADLTGHNANVFYELAVRHLLRKPYVQLIQKGEKPPFDTVGIRTIEYELTDPDSVDAARNEVEQQIAFTTANPDKVTSPMSATIELSALSRSDDPVKRDMASILESITSVSYSLRAVMASQEQLTGGQAQMMQNLFALRSAVKSINEQLPNPKVILQEASEQPGSSNTLSYQGQDHSQIESALLMQQADLIRRVEAGGPYAKDNAEKLQNVTARLAQLNKNKTFMESSKREP